MDSAGVSYCCLGWALPSDVGSGKCEQYSTNCAAPSWLRQPRHLPAGQEQPRIKSSGREWTSRTRDLVGTPSVLSRVLLVQSFNCSACSFSPGCPNQLVTTQCLFSAVFPLIWIMQRSLFWPTQESQWFPLVSTM